MDPTYTVFDGNRRLARGSLFEVSVAARKRLDIDSTAAILIFDDRTGETVDVDLRGSPESAPARGPGRPKLGVVAREVTLLPRHWEWLSSQPGGASVVLRKLVSEAMRDSEERDAVRRAQNAAYRFMTTLAGNLPHYEDAIRALFAGKKDEFESAIKRWPADVRRHAAHLAQGVFV